MYSQWQPTTGHLNQPIQLWQLEDAHHAVRLAEKRLADAEHAYARETEQLLTTIAAYEHSASVRETTITSLRSQVKLLTTELAAARGEYEATITGTEQRLAKVSLEYDAEAKRMREVVSEYQQTADVREAARNELAASLAKSEAAIAVLQEQNAELAQRIEQKALALAEVDVTAKDRLAESEKLVSVKQTDIQRLREQLDETETQHRSDVETLRQQVAELELAAANEAQTIYDLDRLCDQRAAEIIEANAFAEAAERELIDSKKEHSAEIELFQEEIDSKEQLILTQTSENERLQLELEAKQAELDEVSQMSDSIDSQLNEAVEAHTLQVAKLEAAMAESSEKVSSRKTELRSLAMRTYRRETQFKQIVADLGSEANRRLCEVENEHRDAIARSETEAERMRDVIASLEETGNDRELMIHELKQQVEHLQTVHHEAIHQHRNEIALREQHSSASVNQVRAELSAQVQQLQADLQATTHQLQSTQVELSQAHETIQATGQVQSEHGIQATELQAQLALLQGQHQQAQQEALATISQQALQIESVQEQAAADRQQMTQVLQENDLLRSDLSATQASEATSQQREQQLKARLRKVIRVHRKIKSHPETLQRFRQHVIELNKQIHEQSQLRQQVEFSNSQLSRTVSWLEHSSEKLQDSLQREAAARRKAESVLKQLTDDQPVTDRPSAAQSAAKQIESEEKIHRLTRELEAAKKIRAIERKQAEAELKRLASQLGHDQNVRRAA
ncbi:hypothetical protein [Planctomycetes bacterium K23_9]|uniref:Uncharacterized protein n=1 Tax=Stieleria marina TaxID=1930275 RepID=A0A517P1D9_9BACT|nr:hypothetical protein K239x_52050 [Planctomycetes bacterium K23_9]